MTTCIKCSTPTVESKLMCPTCYEKWRAQALKADDKLADKPACRPEYTERLPIKE